MTHQEALVNARFHLFREALAKSRALEELRAECDRYKRERDAAVALLNRVSMRYHEIEAAGGDLTAFEDQIWADITALLSSIKD